METQSELQDWQKEILENMDKYGSIFGDYEKGGVWEETFELLPQQKEMIEKVLSNLGPNPFYVVEKYETILKEVLSNDCYGEGDKEALNYVRECYLKGRNFIK